MRKTLRLRICPGIFGSLSLPFLYIIIAGLFSRLTQNKNLLLLPFTFFSRSCLSSVSNYLGLVYHQFPTLSGSCLSSVSNLIWVLFIISFQPYLGPVYHQYPTLSRSSLSSVSNLIQVLIIISFQPYLGPVYHILRGASIFNV